MDKIKRWDWVNQMVRGDDGGRFVKYADHEEVVAELAKVREQYQKMFNSQNNEITRLRAEADSLRKDAERYQYIRNFMSSDAAELVASWADLELDQAIDAAMGAKA